jgi:hypothetical protein
MSRQRKKLFKFLKLFSFLVILIIIGIIFEVKIPVSVVIFSLIIYLDVFRKKVNFRFLPLAFLFIMMISSAKVLLNYFSFPYLVPIPAISMLSTILFSDLELGIILTLGSCIYVGAMANANFYLTVILFIAGLISSLSVINIRRRSEIMRAGFISGVVQLFCILIISDFQIDFLGKDGLISLINGVGSAIFVIGSLPIFEYLFKVVTNISLLELLDFNHPLLRKMILDAPGTYHHSLLVGNLSEVASEAIGANSLLSRVGSYYHDIGKIGKSEYFTENQPPSSDKHSQLKPTVSKLVIMNHVKEGVELGRKYHLPEPIIDFIRQHHGTSLVYFFYRRAIEEGKQREVEEEVFRYPGPKPATKETAIVLLADSVEAASRTISDPTPSKIRDLVHEVINNKFIDGQLDACDLTLKDLEIIASVFTRLLSAIYHARVEYPQRPQDKDSKSSKDISFKS